MTTYRAGGRCEFGRPVSYAVRIGRVEVCPELAVAGSMYCQVHRVEMLERAVVKKK